jgi:alpha-L-rhamnosidase
MYPRLILPGLLAAVGLLAGCQGIVRRPAVEVTELRCEQAVAPLGVDVAQPQIGWQLRSGVRDTRQIAWQVLAASTPELLARDQGDLWDSGRVASSAMAGVTYAGRPLASLRQVFWKVRVWTATGPAEVTAGQRSPWSPPAS